MLLLELEERVIKPLPRFQKLQLIADITRMLQEEEKTAEHYFEPGVEYPIFTPTIAPDDSGHEAAYQLQQLLEGEPQ